MGRGTGTVSDVDTVAGRPFSLVLRLLPGPGLSGRLVGIAEVVATGDQIPLKDAADLVALVRLLAATAEPVPP